MENTVPKEGDVIRLLESDCDCDYCKNLIGKTLTIKEILSPNRFIAIYMFIDNGKWKADDALIYAKKWKKVTNREQKIEANYDV